METRAVIFDCFGVLYLDAKQSLLNTLPAERAQELADIFQQNNYGLLSRDEYVKAAVQVSDMSEQKFVEFVAAEHRLNTVLIDEIKRLKSDYKIGLLSNIGRGWIDDFFSKNQLHDLFDTVVLSGEEGITKPHPDIFRLIATRLNVAPEQCVMIDDIADNCAGADAAGMRSIEFRSNPQTLKELGELLTS